MVLIGWRFDILVLTCIIPGLACMNPASACCFILAGISFLGGRRPGAFRTVLIGLASLAILTIGSAKLLDLFGGFHFGLDQALFRAKLEGGMGRLPNRMAPNTAFNLCLLGVSLFLLHLGKWTRAVYALTLGMTLLSFLALIGYVYRFKPLYGILHYVPMALHTAFCFLLLGFAILAAYPDRGLSARLGSAGPGGMLLRRMLPTAIVLPLLLGWLNLMGEERGWMGKELGLALMIIVIVGAMGGMLYWMAAHLDEMSRTRKEFAAAQVKRDERYKAVLEGSLDACFIFRYRLDENGRPADMVFDQINSRGGEMLGIPSARLEGKGLCEVFPWMAARGTVGKLAAAVAGGRSVEDEVHVDLPDLNIKWMRYQLIPLSDGMAVICRDIADRKAREDEVLKAKLAAEEANRTKSDFLASMSHELRTPLNSVIGFSGILLKNKNGNLEAGQTSYLERIHANGKHLLGLINDILDLSKIEAGKMQMAFSQVDLRGLLMPMADQFEAALADRPIDLVFDIPLNMIPVRADPGKLTQVLINLIGNAVKFTEIGRISLIVDVDADGCTPCRIHVWDSGIGIEEKHLESVFSAFQQGEAGTSRKYGGTGLGLTICKSMLDAMGFGLTVSSRLGKGSDFVILLKETDAWRPGGAFFTFSPNSEGNHGARDHEQYRPAPL